MLRILKGDIPVQETGAMHLGADIFQLEDGPLIYSQPTIYQASCGSLECRGRCIGGCIDVLKDLIGTEYDQTREFVRRYAEDGIIWYFDNFSLSSAVLYRTFLQMRYAGWITPETTRAVLIGRTLFEREESEMSYEDAVRMAFPDLPVIWEMDIGHTVPHFSMINGAILNVEWDGKKTRLQFELK
jgi:muramoyltetrapeptide carboxypeptidase LdcA involved in peptidoglycan recycling